MLEESNTFLSPDVSVRYLLMDLASLSIRCHMSNITGSTIRVHLRTIWFRFTSTAGKRMAVYEFVIDCKQLGQALSHRTWCLWRKTAFFCPIVMRRRFWGWFLPNVKDTCQCVLLSSVLSIIFPTWSSASGWRHLSSATASDSCFLLILLPLSLPKVHPQREGVLRGRGVPHGPLLAVSVPRRNLLLLQGRVRWAGLWELLHSWGRVLPCLLRYMSLVFCWERAT